MRALGLLSLCIMLFVAGCSQKPKESSSVVHLRFSVLGSKQESDLGNSLARDFEKTHPNIKIDVEPVAGMGYDMKLIMQSAAGTVPDVLFMADSLVPQFIKFKVVRDLTDDIKNDPTFDLKDIYPEMLSTGMDSRGHIYMLPRELGAVVMFYNKTLFKRAGVPYPTRNWTYDEFLADAKKLTIKDKDGSVKQYGFSGMYSWPGLYPEWIASQGGSVLSKDGRVTLSSPASLKGLRTLTDLVTKYGVAMPPNQSLTAPGIDPFAAGKVAMVPQIFPQVPQFRATMKQFEWDAQVMPAGRVRRVVNIGAAGFGISASTKHPKESWEFLKYILSKDGQRIFGATGSGIPALKSLAHDPSWRKTKENPKDLDAFIDSVKYGMSMKTVLTFSDSEISDRVNEAFEKVFTSGVPMEDAFKEADVKINKILAKEREDGE
jgi:multiple sugar transport system substrate-binding protein